MIVTHGHSDHFGAARYLQDTYGAKVFLSKADWDLMDAPPAQGKGAPAPQPKRDQVVADLQPIVLGDTSILPVLIPGHTPGALALMLIRAVFDAGQEVYGGTVRGHGAVGRIRFHRGPAGLHQVRPALRADRSGQPRDGRGSESPADGWLRGEDWSC